ncbi:MAG: hypothetical protein KatS3mg115_2402 [Candidatus Poribacteria bacterium]|nr:MAG: hypothetical protein KatS3mg115_2402 [Candidatus Poribacteria bacterium]
MNFKGAVVVAGNRFQARYLDRVLRIGDRLFVELPMRRLDRIEQVELREYFRTPYLLRLDDASGRRNGSRRRRQGAVDARGHRLCRWRCFWRPSSPDCSVRTVQAAQSAGWIIGGAIAVTGVLWSLRSLWDPEVRTTVWGLMLRRWKRLAAWLGVGALGGAAMALAVRLIGQRACSAGSAHRPGGHLSDLCDHYRITVPKWSLGRSARSEA